MSNENTTERENKISQPHEEEDAHQAKTRDRRERQPTEKMKILQEETQRKKENKFNATYERWKQEVRSARTLLKGECTEEDLGSLLDEVKGLQAQVSQAYDVVRAYSTPKQAIKRRMDSCSAVTQDIASLIQHRISEVGDTWDGHMERQRLHSLLDKEFARSVYGSASHNPPSSQDLRQAKVPTQMCLA